MKQETKPSRRATALLLAAAALPLAPVLAQDAQPPQTAVDASPPAAEPAPQAQAPAAAPAPTMTPVVNTEPSGNEPGEVADAPAARTGTANRATRTAPRRAAATPAPARAARTAAAPAAVTSPAPAVPAPVAPPISESPSAPLAATPPVPVEAAPAPAPEATAPAAAEPPRDGSIWPWVFAGLALIAAALFLIRRRRRRAEEEEYHHEPAYEPAPAVEPEATPVTAAAAAPMAAEPIAEPEPVPAERGASAAIAPMPAAGAAPLNPFGAAAFGAGAFGAAPAAAAEDAAAPAAPAEMGRPEIDLAIEPVRAGVQDDEAVVEFALAVDNHGTAPARDVQISTWMFPAGTEPSEMERALIKSPAAATLANVDAGGVQRIESAVALPRPAINADSVLPVVVAEARYRLSDGSEGRTSAAFAVGVPWEGQLAHFDVENPSGLHEGVEAWPLGDVERV